MGIRVMFGGLCFAMCAAAAGAGSPMAAVQQLFDAIAAHDGAMGRAVVMPEGRYFLLREKGAMGGATLGEFVDQLPKRTEKLEERIFSPMLSVRGKVATLVAPYDFHRDGKFSHCGTDAFLLIETGEGWKIASLAYTVEAACPAGVPAPRLK